jgi:DNA-binding transcriptional LysR family regulator
MNFRHVEVFFAVMTNGTVTEAARQLGVSQPSVTTTLKQAEAKLGIQLFLREGGRLTPTEEARILFEEAERAHEALEALQILAKRLEIGRGGHVRIAAVPTVSLQLLPDAIERFEKLHTGFRYSVATLNTEEMLTQLDTRKGTFHLGFTYGDQSDSGFAHTVIGQTELLAVFPKDWGLGNRDAIDLADIADRPFISGFDQIAIAMECRRMFADVGVEPNTVARSHMHYLAGCLVQRGVGYTIVDSLTIRALLDNERKNEIDVVPIKGNPSLPLTALYPAQRGVNNPGSVFIECIQEAYQALREEVTKEIN